MSQVSIIDIEGNNPQIPTQFDADVGFAIPIANTLEILGDTVPAGILPVHTTGSGNTITTNVQISQAIAASNALNVGLAAFDSADFSVDANGFVSFNGSALGGTNVDASTAPGTDPVVPNGSGIITVTGSQVGASSIPIRTNSLSANTYTIEIQRSSASASPAITSNGISHFDSARFTITAAGFVSTLGTGVGSTITGNSGGAISPSSGNWNIVTANSTVKFIGSGSTLTQDFSLANLCLGSSLPSITSGTQTVSLGQLAVNSLTSGNGNTAIGYSAGNAISSAAGNTLCGASAMYQASTSGQNTASGYQVLANLGASAGQNSIYGYSAYNGLTTGAYNIGLGHSCGSSYTGSESSNICIGNAGTLGDSNVMRLGTTGAGNKQVSTAYIAGTVGVTVSNPVPVYINSSTGQLGVGPASGFTWTDVSGATQTLAVQNGYLTDRGAGVVYTLPSTASIGDTIKIVGKLGLATITPNANQQICVGSVSGTVGVTGTAIATNLGDCMTLICTTAGASTVWRAANFVGSWTVS